jgi:hypothetical protein
VIGEMPLPGSVQNRPAADRQSEPARHVRFAPKAEKDADVSASPLCATSGCEQSQQGSPLFDHLVGAGE